MAWDGQANRTRLFGDEALDVGRGHVTLDKVAIDFGGVTRGKFIADACFFF